MDEESLSELGRAALDYVRRGFAVIPLWPKSKKPRTEHGLNDWTDDPGSVVAIWTAYPDCNVGIVCGKPSGGLAVVDIDEHDGESGYDAVRAWENAHGALPETCSAVTGSGGVHLLYRVGREVRPSVNEALLVDIRGDGSYIVAPPSVHPNGRRYEWESPPDEVSVAWADENVLAFIDHVRPKQEGERFTAPREVGKGGRNDTIFKLACSMQAKEEPDEDILDYCLYFNSRRCSPPLPEDEVRRTVESALGYRKGLSDEARALAKPDKETPVSEVKAELDVDGKGVPKPTVYNLTVILSKDELLAGRLWFNKMAYSKYITTPCPWDDGADDRPISDYDYGHIRAYIEHKYGIKVAKDAMVDAIGNVCTTNARNPLTEWLDSLVWDGEERIWSVLPVFVGAAADRASAYAARVFMLGAVARAYEPGIKFDYMLVLAGPQGIGKSSLAKLFGVRREWYCDNLNTVDGDAAAEKIRGMWVCEMAELLASKNTKTVEAVKAFMSSAVDTIRPKYARETEQRPRTCVFIGTTNSSNFLTDKTGNRRFISIPCGVQEPTMSPVGPTPEASAYMEQCWAEAVHIWKTERPNLKLPDDVAEEIFGIQERYIEDDPRIGIVQRYLDSVMSDETRPNHRVCVAELCSEALEMEPREWQNGRKVVNELHEIMANSIEGWARCDGKKWCGKWGSQVCYEPSH